MGPREQLLDTLAEQYWAISDDLVDADLHQRLYEACQVHWQLDHFKAAKTGRQHTSLQNADVRGDAICWLAAGEPGSATDDFLAWADTLRADINRMFHAGLNSAEFHFARYPQGQGYIKHMDAHQGGSSRRISLVLYLNRQWADTDGGELCLYSPDDPERIVKRVLPRPGRLVVFRSDLVPHEVRPCAQPRWSLTGWLRSDYP